MADKKIEQLKKALEASLAKQLRHSSDEAIKEMARFMETDLATLVVSYLMPEFQGIYRETKSTLYDELLKKLATNSSAKAIDDNEGQRYQQGLKLYRAFLKSKFFPKPNLKVMKREAEASNPIPSAKTIYVEGAVTQQTVDRRERNPKARAEAIERDKCRCRVCEFDFEKIYGEAGKGYIEVHHTDPISNHDDEYEVDIDKLVCLCANCHAIAHRRSPIPFTIGELKQMRKNAKPSS